MLRFLIFFIQLVLVVVTGLAQPKQLVLFIGDGFGIAPKTATRMALQQGQMGRKFSGDPNFQVLALDRLRYQTTLTTHSYNSWITDSAPGASVYACGKAGKIDNEVVSFDPETQQPIESILEQAKKAGYAIGVVTNTRVTHATPAAFTAHSWSRDLEEYIALQQISSDQSSYEKLFSDRKAAYNPNIDWVFPKVKEGVLPDVLMGGGLSYFAPKGEKIFLKGKNGVMQTDSSGKEVVYAGKRTDQMHLLNVARKNQYATIHTREELLALNPLDFKSNQRKLLGLFAPSHMSYEVDRQLLHPWQPSLADMTAKAIEILKVKGGEKGFVLIVEGGRIDHLGHANAGCTHKEAEKWVIEADSAAFPPDYEGKRLYTTAIGLVTGAEYMIKEVCAFDQAIEESLKLLKNKQVPTCIFVTSDHETGGFSVVGLHDEADTQQNGTKIRTYAEEISQPEVNSLTPTQLKRGDLKTGGWFPDYKLYPFQGRWYPRPASDTARRIVVAYGSNPFTNGNGMHTKTPGNHTPQDVLLYADDNQSGKWASKITGRGQLDNTDVYPLMCDFLSLKPSKK